MTPEPVMPPYLHAAWAIKRDSRPSDGTYLLINSSRATIYGERNRHVATMDISSVSMGLDGNLLLVGYVSTGKRFKKETWTCTRL